MSTRLSIDYAEHADAFPSRLPRTGVVVRRVLSRQGRSWELLRLDSAFEYRSQMYEWLLIRFWDKQPDIEGSEAMLDDALLVGDTLRVDDGFEETDFANLGYVSAHPTDAIRSGQKTRLPFLWVAAAALLFIIAAWYVWRT